MDYVKTGRKIRAQRRILDITQAQLAELCGISTAFVGHIERGTRKMSLETLAALCRILQLSADDLLEIE